MKESEITALAREYAEEIYPNLSDKIISLRTQEIKDAERFIRFLLRRFCLVEKEVVRNEYQETRGRETYATEHKNELYAKLLEMKRLVLESLFPDIAKEVEG